MIIRKLRSPHWFFWGWIIVGVSAAVLGINAGTAWYANSVYLIPLQRHFQTERTIIAQGFALTHLLAAAVYPLLGVIVDRWGPRRILLIGLTGLAATHFLLSRMTALWQFYVLILLQQALFMRFNEPLTVQALLGRWFLRLRGRAAGLGMAGVGMGGLTLPALAGVMIERYGWRSGYLLAGALVAGLVLPAVFFLIVDEPARVGQHPDGASEAPKVFQGRTSGATFAQAIRSRLLWTLALSAGLCYVEHGVMSLQMPAMLQDVGLSVSASASFFGLMLGVSTVGRLSIGALTDRFDRTRILALSLAGMAIGAAMMFWPASPAARIVYVFVYGVFSGGVFTVLPVVGQALFGLHSFGKIYAIVLLTATLGTAAGNYLGARFYDWQSNYSGAVWLAVISAAVAAALALTLRPREWR